MPNGKCRMHGGQTPVGFALPHTQSGRYSKYLPTRLSERYQEAVTDTELLAMREDIALVDARLSDLLKRVDSGESGTLWRQLKDTFKAFRDARGTEFEFATLAALEETIDKGHSDYVAWDAISDALEQRRKLVESERKRLLDMQQMISSERAMLLISAFVDVVRRNVTDRNVLATISADIGKLLNRSDARGVES